MEERLDKRFVLPPGELGQPKKGKEANDGRGDTIRLIEAAKTGGYIGTKWQLFGTR